eukprot:CAMPEP_0194538178 /NCGR_PEP_ID=MMETSP0253-20130528/77631_1 /TAXON_ID=2966 /ORGANISM="Noctiluca scintillans" /LENGTH=264 /DNA_ID=CAMNT_0039384257 /DNA_START=472 /DNA_END=1264 /DNA_ORIENTATION=+
MKRFHNELGLDAVGKILGAAELVHFTGRRSRLLAHHMGLHPWIRSLQVLGRGGPVFILQDYTSREEMMQILVSDVVRHGLPAISVAQVGGEDAGALLAHFTEMTFMAPALASAAAIPERSLDVLFLETHFQRQDIEAWEQRVKLGGILGGSGFSPLSSVVPTIVSGDVELTFILVLVEHFGGMWKSRTGNNDHIVYMSLRPNPGKTFERSSGREFSLRASAIKRHRTKKKLLFYDRLVRWLQVSELRSLEVLESVNTEEPEVVL